MHMAMAFRVPVESSNLGFKDRILAKVLVRNNMVTMSKYRPVKKICQSPVTNNNINFNGGYTEFHKFITYIFRRYRKNSIGIYSPVRISNGASTSDTYNTGIINNYQTKNLMVSDYSTMSRPVKVRNFPAIICPNAITTAAGLQKNVSVIFFNNTMNTCRDVGADLTKGFCSQIRNMTGIVSIDSALQRLKFNIERVAKELTPGIIIRFILYAITRRVPLWQIEKFIISHVECSRYLTTSVGNFTKFGTLSKSSLKLKAIDFASIKYSKMKDVSKMPLTTRNELLERLMLRYPKYDFQRLVTKKLLYSRRSRNIHFIEMMLTSPDDYFYNSEFDRVIAVLKERYADRTNYIHLLNSILEFRADEMMTME